MSKKKFVTGSARKSVARPEPPHEDRRTKRNRTRQAVESGAIDESAESSDLCLDCGEPRNSPGAPGICAMWHDEPSELKHTVPIDPLDPIFWGPWDD